MAANVIGIRLENKERYDHLMEAHSLETLSGGINFKGLFDGYPTDYPCLVEYYIGDENPFTFMYTNQLKELMDDGYLIRIYKDEAG